MSVVGIDIGNAFCVVAVAGKGGVDVILNEESKRETPACVVLGERQRFLGAAAASPTPGAAAVSQIKRLIGRPLADDALKRDLKTLFPNLRVSEDAEGYPLIHFNYRREELKLSPTQLLGMLLGSLKRSAERHLSATVSNCCIAVPAHFDNVQRRAVLQAAEIAGLRPLRLLHECSAAALEYGIYRGDLPDRHLARPHVAAIVDVGHSAAQVAIAEFRAGEARILARAADPNLGGRDFDEALFNHFAVKLKADGPELEVSRSSRASARLRTACEKVKKVLSANTDASLHIECFMEDKDASGTITRDEFDMLCEPLLLRLRQIIGNALEQSRLAPENVEAVELIGSGSRLPAVVRMVGEVFRQEARRTLNASECVARGCALQAAMLSPAFRVKSFTIHECVPSAIVIFWEDSVSEEIPSCTLAEEKLSTEKGCNFSKAENVFSFDMALRCTTDNPAKTTLSTYRVGPIKFTRNGLAKLKIGFIMDCLGVVSVDSVTMLMDEVGPRSYNMRSDDRVRIHTDEKLSSHCLQSFAGADKLEKTNSSNNEDDSRDSHNNNITHVNKKASIGPFKLNAKGSAELQIAFKLSCNGNASVDPVSMFPGIDDKRSLEDPTEDGSRVELYDNRPSHNLHSAMDAYDPDQMHEASRIAASAGIPDSWSQFSNIRNISVLPENDGSKCLVEPIHEASSMDIDDTAPSHHLHSEMGASKPEQMVPKVNECSNSLQTFTADDLEMDIDEDSTHLPGNEIVAQNPEKTSHDSARVPDSGYECAIDCKMKENSLEEELHIQFSEHIHGVLSKESLQSAINFENQMTAWDREVEETKDRKNALESFVYEMRSKLRGKYAEYVSDVEKQSFFDRLQESETWLYEEGDDVDCCSYISKLNDLKSLRDPIDLRIQQRLEWQQALDQLLTCNNNLVALLNDKRHAYTHIDNWEKQRIWDKCEEVSCWLSKWRTEQGALPKHLDPVVGVAEIQSRFDALTRLWKLHTTAAGREHYSRKKALESYVRGMMDKLCNEYQEYVSNVDRHIFVDKLKQTLKWLHEEGKDVEWQSSYAGRLNELKMLGDPIEARFRASLERMQELDQLLRVIDHMFRWIDSKRPDIESQEMLNAMEKIWHECGEASDWLNRASEALNAQPKYEIPVITVADIHAKRNLLIGLKRSYETAAVTNITKSSIGNVFSRWRLLNRLFGKDVTEKSEQSRPVSDDSRLQLPSRHKNVEENTTAPQEQVNDNKFTGHQPQLSSPPLSSPPLSSAPPAQRQEGTPDYSPQMQGVKQLEPLPGDEIQNCHETPDDERQQQQDRSDQSSYVTNRDDLDHCQSPPPSSVQSDNLQSSKHTNGSKNSIQKKEAHSYKVNRRGRLL